MTDTNIEPADSQLADLRARAAAPHAGAADCLAFGHLLLERAGRDKALRREALAALVRAYQLDPSCEPTLLHTIAQTAFIVRDWSLVAGRWSTRPRRCCSRKTLKTPTR